MRLRKRVFLPVLLVLLLTCGIWRSPSVSLPRSLPFLAPPFPSAVISRAPAASSSPAPELSRPRWESGDEQRLAELLGSGDLCAVLRSPLTSSAPPSVLYSFLRGPGTGGPLPPEALDAYVRALDARSPAELRAAFESQAHPALRILEGAALLGALPGLRANLPRDPRAAVAVLRAATSESPANAVPALLLAQALDALGDHEGARLELSRAVTLPEYRTWVEETMQSITLRALDRPAILPAALALTASAPVPNLHEALDLVLESLVDADAAFARDAYTFGRRLVARETAQSGRAEFLFWSALDYRLGQRLARAAWRRLEPEAALPGDLGVPLEALLRRSPAAFSRMSAEEGCGAGLSRLTRDLRRQYAEATRETGGL